MFQRERSSKYTQWNFFCRCWEDKVKRRQNYGLSRMYLFKDFDKGLWPHLFHQICFLYQIVLFCVYFQPSTLGFFECFISDSHMVKGKLWVIVCEVRVDIGSQFPISLPWGGPGTPNPRLFSPSNHHGYSYLVVCVKSYFLYCKGFARANYFMCVSSFSVLCGSI